MKVEIIGTAYPFRGGLASFNERLIQEYSGMGHDTKIHTFTTQYPEFLFPGATQFSSDPQPQDIEIERSFSSVNPFSWFKAASKIKQEQPDLLLTKYWLPFMAPCLGTICRNVKKQTKTIAIIDNIIPHEKRIGDWQLSKYFANSVDGFVVMSQSVGEEIAQFTSNKNISYLPHPIYDNYGEIVSKQEACNFLKLNSEDKIILFFGFIRKYKGLDLLLQAMASPALKAQNIKLIVAGEYYGDQEYYEKMIVDLNIGSQVKLFPNFISNQEVKYYFGAADVVVQPYKTATQSGISQMAYHFEKPMIVTNVGGLPEIVPHNKVGLVCNVDADAVATSILAFYNENLQSKFIENIKIEKKKYSWESFANGILSLYNKL